MHGETSRQSIYYQNWSVASFSRESITMALLMSQKTARMALFTNQCALNCSFTQDSVHFNSMDYFSIRALSGKLIFSSFVKFFCFVFNKTCFSLYITHSSWFSLFTHQTFDDRPLFKPGERGLICHHFE